LLIRGLFMPGELQEVMDADLVREGLRRLRPLHYIEDRLSPDPGTARSRVAVLEAALYMRNTLLRDADWASMAHSLEVRTPLVDSHLVKRLSPVLVPCKALQAKDLLAQSPTLALPEPVRTRIKSGFSTPVTEWIAGDPAFQTGNRTEAPVSTHQPSQWNRRWAQHVASVAV
jgi:asparagine synthase (glutamine-hydrolysing)